MTHQVWSVEFFFVEKQAHPKAKQTQFVLQKEAKATPKKRWVFAMFTGNNSVFFALQV